MIPLLLREILYQIVTLTLVFIIERIIIKEKMIKTKYLILFIKTYYLFNYSIKKLKYNKTRNLFW